MKTTIGVLALALAALLLGGSDPASAADEQTLLQYTSRDTGVPVEKLQQEKSETRLSPYDLRMAHLVSEGMRLDVKQVVARFKAGEPWHVIARSAGLSPREIERIAQRHRIASRH